MQQRQAILGNSRSCGRSVAIIGLLALGGCAADRLSRPSSRPCISAWPMAAPALDPQAAASMISQYRQNNGLGAVAVDPDLDEACRAAVAGDGEPQTSSITTSRRRWQRRLDAVGLSARRWRSKMSRPDITPWRKLFGLARLAAAPGQYAQKRCHKIGHRGELCSKHQVQGVLDAHSCINGCAINSGVISFRRLA